MNKDINIEKYDFDEFEKEKKPYTMLLTEVIQTIKNPQAFLIWAFLQSLPIDWVPSKSHIMNHFDLSERVYQRLMSYLNQSNLIEYRRNRNFDGTLGKIKLIVLSGIKFKPDIENDQAAKNGGVVNNGNISIQSVQLHQAAILPGPGQPTRVAFGDVTKTIDLQSQELKEQSLERPTQAQLNLQCLADRKCLEIFNSKFKSKDITIEDILEGCVWHYALQNKPQMVSPHRFRNWLTKEFPENHPKREINLATQIHKTLSPEEKELIQDYNYWLKNPDIMGEFPQNKKIKAERLIQFLNESKKIKKD